MSLTRMPGRKTVAVALLVFHVLAAGRALVPGMCQTLAAAKDGQASCCAAACPLPQGKPGGISLDTPANEHPPCPFCHLVCTAAHTAPMPAVAVSFGENVVSVDHRYREPDSRAVASGLSVRAPPLHLPA